MGEDENVKRILWYVFAGTKGGPTRVKIMQLLLARPYNINQIRAKLKMDYKTVAHHIKMLEGNSLVTYGDQKRYASMYFPTAIFKKGEAAFSEIIKAVNHDTD